MKNLKKTVLIGSLLLVAFFLIFFGYSFYLKSAYPIKYSDTVEEFSEKYNVDKALVFGVIRCESNFNKDAVSSAGAKGLMQITPETFQWLQKKVSSERFDENQLFVPKVNIQYGVYFLSMLLKKYENETAALSAYNAGMGSVDKWLANEKYSLDGKNLSLIPYKETNNYVKKVISSRDMYQKLYF